MFGFLIGFASLVGLISVLKAGRRGRCGAGWHGHHHHHKRHRRGRGGPPWARGRRDGWGVGPWASRAWLGFLEERLEATPTQSREIRAATREFTGELRTLRQEGPASRSDVAGSIRGDVLDETLLGELFTRHDDRLREVRKAFVGMVGRIHAILDDEQRRRLADLIEDGPRGYGPPRGEPGGDGGPYRDWM